MENKKFSIKKRVQSFRHAFRGLRISIMEEHNVRIHLGATILVFVFGFFLRVSLMEWIALIISIALVWAMELINSSIERICDFISPKKDDTIKNIKDISAAAVLVVSLSSAIVGLLIFLPKLWHLFISLI